jgi:predicted HAD superfamily phosphohydrolase
VLYSAAGSPFHPKVTDRSKVVLMDDLTDLKDENDHLALVCDSETVLSFNTSEAGPGMCCISFCGDEFSRKNAQNDVFT